MPFNLHYWSPPTPIETPPAGQWIEVARRHYPASMVRVKLVPLVGYYSSALLKALLQQVPAILTPIHAIDFERCVFAILSDEIVAGRLWQYLNEHRLQTPFLKERGTQPVFQTFELLSTAGFETVLAGWQISTRQDKFEMTLSVHPHPAESDFLIEAAPEVNFAYAEAVADGILTTDIPVMGFRAASPLSYMRLCLHQITPHTAYDPAQGTSHSPEQLEAKRLRELPLASILALNILLHAIETALVTPDDTTGYAVQTRYPPASIEHPVRLKTNFVPPPITEPVPQRRLLATLEVTTSLNDVPNQSLLRFTPLPDSNEIICETAVPNDLRHENILKDFFRTLVYCAAQRPNEFPLLGFRVTLLEMDISHLDAPKVYSAANMVWKEVLRKGEIVILNAE